jgi:signal peptidase I
VKRSQLAREIIEIAAIALLIIITIRFVIQSYHVESSSMQPGLAVNQYVMVNKTAYFFRNVERGDVVVFHAPRNTNQDFIERVVGLPGDTIQMDSTTIRINGTLLNEPYVRVPVNPVANTWKVPSGQYFVLNDNREVDDDSRTWSFVPKDYIVGKAVLVYWPLGSWQFIDTQPAVYSQIKQV